MSPLCVEESPVFVPNRTAKLTKREVEILKLIGDGKDTEQIASALSIAYKTVQNHRRNLYTKTGVYNSATAAHLAISLGLTKLYSFPHVTIQEPVKS